MKAVIYIRVSDPGQIGGLSLDVQREVCTRYAEQNGYEVVGVYEDGGKSGTKTVGRDALTELLARCKQGDIDVCLTVDSDRIARNEFDYFLIKQELSKYGTKYIAVNQPMINDSPEGHLIETIFAGTNAFYSRLTGRKVKLSLQKKWNDGWYPSWAPLGYLNVNIGTEDKPNRVIQIVPIVGPLIREMFELYSTCNYSILQLTKVMKDKGLLARHGKALSVSTSQQILTNTFYYGLMRYAGQEKIGKHEPLITKYLFDRCQYVASQHRQFLIRKRIHTFVLRGFAFCPTHGRRLTAEWHKYHHDHYKKKKIGYYHCTIPGGCKPSYIEVDKAESMVAKRLKQFEFSEKFINLIKQEAENYYLQNTSENKSNVQGLINRKKSIEENRDKLEKLLISGDINRDIFHRQHEDIQSQITQIETKIKELENIRQLDVNFVDELLSFTRNIYQTYLDAPEFLRRHYLRMFFEKIYFKDEKIVKVTETPTFSALKEAQHLLIRSNWLLG